MSTRRAKLDSIVAAVLALMMTMMMNEVEDDGDGEEKKIKAIWSTANSVASH